MNAAALTLFDQRWKSRRPGYPKVAEACKLCRSFGVDLMIGTSRVADLLDNECQGFAQC